MKEKSSETSVRIQTSILNGVEKKALTFLADRQPRWMTSNILTGIGTFGAIVISLGYILSQININYLWLSSLGFVINWYGDSLDGTLARVRNKQRPIFGYYIDHTVDIINELLIFLGLGLSGLICFDLSLFILIVYMMLTLNVSINAHLKKEFRLTYAKLGPTEFRVLAIIFNTVCIYCPAISGSVMEISMFGKDIVFGSLDIAGVFVLLVLIIMYIVTVLNDIKDYDKIDPMK